MLSEIRSMKGVVNTLILLAICLMAAAFAPASAQACPQGISSAGNPSCIPPDLSGSSGAARGSTRAVPLGRWHKTWGAVAMDYESSGAGVALQRFSRKDAEREALTQCALKGHLNCKVRLTFHNQCGAVAGSVGGNAIGLANAPSESRASASALRQCEGPRCEVWYSGCTKPIFERF